MSRRLIPLWRVVREDLLPFHRNSYSRGKSLGRWPWLTRQGPSGPSNILWVDVDALVEWVNNSGSQLAFTLDLEALVAAAVVAPAVNQEAAAS